jgi:tetratricopeptide (TPR) repeat protein
VARAIELLFSERLEEFYGLLAYHYSKAEAWDKAQEYLLKAGDQAGRIAADAEALSLYQQAMSAYARAFGDKWDPLQRASLERKMGEALLRRGEYAPALERFGTALTYLGYRLPMSRGQVRWALLREVFVQSAHRLRRKPFKPAPEPYPPGTEDEIFIFAHTGFIDAFNNVERFLMLAYRILNVSEQRGYAPGFVIGSCQLGIALDILPLHKLAESYHRGGVETAEVLGQPYSLGAAYVGLQVHQFYTGKLADSIENGRRTISIYRQAGDLEEWGFSTAFYIHACLQVCDFDEGLNAIQELLQVGQDAQLRALSCWGNTALGQLHRRQGHLQEAIACERKALEIAKAIPDYVFQVAIGAELGLCHLLQGDWQAARAELDICQQVAKEHRVVEPHSRMNLLNNLAALSLYALEHGDASQRSAWSNKARRACRSAKHPPSAGPGCRRPCASRVHMIGCRGRLPLHRSGGKGGWPKPSRWACAMTWRRSTRRWACDCRSAPIWRWPRRSLPRSAASWSWQM